MGRLLAFEGLLVAALLTAMPAAASDGKRDMTLCTVQVSGMLALDRPRVLRAVDDALRHTAPPEVSVKFERGIRSERAAVTSGCHAAIGMHAHGRRRRAFLSVRAVHAIWSEPLLLEVGPVDLARPDSRALRGWARRVWDAITAE